MPQRSHVLHGQGHPRTGGGGRVPGARERGTGHADLIAARIVQLGGSPDFGPQGLLKRSHSEYVEGDSLVEMIREEVAERIAIESYGEMVRYIGDADPTLLDTLDPTKEGRG